jgi:hypothetical protein
MSKAEDRALEKYPKETRDIGGIVIDIGHPQYMRDLYIEGYHQAEKDLELTWNDIADILDVTDVIANDDSMEERLKTMSEEEFYKEVLNRFKKGKG